MAVEDMAIISLKNYDAALEVTKRKSGNGTPITSGDLAQRIEDIPGPKPEQEKTVNITESGIYDVEVLPDAGKTMNKVIAKVDVKGGGGFPNGAIWEKSYGEHGSEFRSIAFCGASGLWITNLASNYMMFSEDGGKNWEIAANTNRARVDYYGIAGLTIIGSSQQREAPIISKDGGRTWENTTLQEVGYSIAFFSGNNWLLSSSDAMFYSKDNGMTWNISQNGFKSPDVRVCSKTGVCISAYFKEPRYSTDNGETWINSKTKIPGYARCLWECFDIFYIGTDNGVYESKDLGVNWSKISSTPVKWCIVMNGCFLGYNSEGMVKSVDFGKTWTQKLTLASPHGIEATEIAVLIYDDNKLYYSYDDGETWNLATALLGNFYMPYYAPSSSLACSGKEWAAIGKESYNPCILRSAIWEPPV